MPKDPFVVELRDVIGEFLERAEEDPSLFGKNAERLAERIRQSDQPEVLSSLPVGGEDRWCDRCEMSHPKTGCPPVRRWLVNLVTEMKPGVIGARSVGCVAARGASSALALALEKFGHMAHPSKQRISVDTDDYIRTCWERLLDDELRI